MGGDWQESSLTELGRVARGRSRHRPRYAKHLYGGPYPFIQTGDVKASNGRITEHTQTYSEAGLEQSRLWPINTLCITIAANIAETGILTYPACFPDSVIGFIADKTKCDVFFMEYMFRFLRRNIQNEASGSVQDNINLQTLERLKFKLPDLNEQKTIAHILGTLDDKIELNRQMNATLESMAQALFKSWFVDFDPVIDNALAAGNPIPEPFQARAKTRKALGDKRKPLPEAIQQQFPSSFVFTKEMGWIPKGWKCTQWGDFAKLQYGKSLKGYRDNEGTIPVYGTNGKVGVTHKALCEKEGIVIGRKGAYRGVHYSHNPFYVIDTAFFLTPSVPMSIKWAYYEILRFDINGMDSGSAIPSTSRDDFNSLCSAFPPSGLQMEFDRIVTRFYEKKLVNESENIPLSCLRDTLLPKLLSGQLRIPDAEKIMADAL